SNLTQVINNFVAPVTDRYYARISGTANTDYHLLVTRDADFDTQPNNDFSMAQPIASTPTADGRQWVLGHVAGQGATGNLSMAIIDTETYGTPDANEVVGRNLGYTVTHLARNNWFQQDLSRFDIVVMPSRFDFSDVNSHLSVLETYVRNGGVLVEHITDFVNNGNLLPGWHPMV